MKAVARLRGISRSMFLRAWKSPYHRSKSRTLMAVSASSRER